MSEKEKYKEELINMNVKMSKQDLIDFERRLADKFEDGEIPYLIHLSGGNEDQLIKIYEEINEGDYIFSTHRSHYHYLLCGGSPEDLEEKILNGKSMFVFDRALNFFSSSIVAASPSIAAGVAWALKRKGSSKKVWCFIGDGAEEEGHFYEAVQYVNGWDLPCTFVVEDNDRSVNASKKERRGISEIMWPKCVRRYNYIPTYPHGGTGSTKWLQFKKEATLTYPPEKQSFKLDNNSSANNLKYFEAVKESMKMLANETNTIFVGYNVKYGSAYGSLKDIPEDQKLETPLAENLMAGLAMGMSLEGFKPVLFFERHEFVLNACDAISNTMDIIETISDGQFAMPVIIKAVAGSVKPFYAGLTHTRNMTNIFRELVSFPVYEPETAQEVIKAYEIAKESHSPVMICEKKELF
jgi:deoxyxylulose-5-phosphate synthase